MKELFQALAPAGVEVYDTFGLDPQLKTQLPCWQEVEELLHWHFEKIPAKTLKELRTQLEGDDRIVTEEVRVGGYGFWIQGPRDDLVAQIVSTDAFTFGDEGILSIGGDSPNNLYAWIDSY